MRASRHPSAEDGYTIIEVMIAALILVVGLMATLTLVEGATRTAATSRAREGATNVAREIVEKTRSMPYASLNTTNLVNTVRAMPGMGGGSGTWTLARRNTTYTVTPTVCSQDDGADGYGAHAASVTWCSGVPAAGTADSQPEDFKRIAVTITWKDVSPKQRSMTMIITRSAQGTADAPQVTAITTTAPAVSDPQNPIITSSSVTTATFKVTASATAAKVIISVDGADVGTATPVGNGADWTYNLNVAPASMSDGSYEIGARADDALGVESSVVTLTLMLSRTAPAAPADLIGGLNKTLVSGSSKWVADLDWSANVERNVVGYHVYRPDGTLVTCDTGTGATTLTKSTACVDTAMQSGTYAIAAVYPDSTGTLHDGPTSTIAVKSSTGRTFTFSNAMSWSSKSYCGGSSGSGGQDSWYDEIESAGTLTSAWVGTTTSENTVMWCSPSETAYTMSPGNITVYAYAKNTSGTSCQAQAAVGMVGYSPTWATAQTIPANSGTTLYTFNFAYPSGLSLAAGKYYTEWTRACSGVQLLVGGASGSLRSRVELAPDFNAPNPPTGLTATRAADNSVTLSWTAPSSGTAVYEYRIYRDGQNYDNRYATTGDTSTTYTDPNNSGSTAGGTHTYYVSAVDSSLEESTLLGPVTK